jgi:H+-translocating NAD(P) transhydrogenase subunit alpha
MLIAIPAETRANEKRVAATPETVKKLAGSGRHQICVQAGAGLHAAIRDSDYEAAGARIVPDAASVYQQADLVLKVQAPTPQELELIRPQTALIGLLNPYQASQALPLAAHGLTAFAMELLPRISRAQSMDVLSSQANIAGYKAVLLAANAYPRFFPMLMTAAGTVKAARVLVLGAGVAGLQAIATARRLGAVIEAFDVRPAVKEQVESLGAKFIEVTYGDDAPLETAGGYARELSPEHQQKQRELVQQHAARADIVITTAQIPGKPAPRLITAETVAAMREGSVIVDLAVESGGNCELSEAGRTVIKHGVTLIGETNLPAQLAADASALYARNLLNFLNLLLAPESGEINLNSEDEIINATLLCTGGELANAKRFNFK